MPRKKTTLFTRFTWIALVFMGALMAALLWKNLRHIKPLNDDAENNFTLYPGFGVYLPNNYAIHGIDVSRYQKRINWRLVQQMQDGGVRIGFAFIKATEGNSFTDEQFARNWQKARAAGLTRGAYLFFRGGNGGIAQARHFMKTVALQAGDLPPVVDIETLNNQEAGTVQLELAECLQMLENHYGVAPIIYSNATFYNTHLQSRFSRYPLWVAHYFERHRPRVSQSWHFWQHTESGRVNGIGNFVDFNVFNGDSAAFKALLLR
jgi:lysozyme